MLEDLSSGAEMWRKASVEISDALIRITMPLLIILILPLPNAKLETYIYKLYPFPSLSLAIGFL